jgi:hypothetical protein
MEGINAAPSFGEGDRRAVTGLGALQAPVLYPITMALGSRDLAARVAGYR